MKLLKNLKFKFAFERALEEGLYAQVAAEIARGSLRDGLWAKALSNANGESDRAEALYIQYRVQSIKDEQTLAEAVRATTGDEDDRQMAEDSATRPSANEESSDVTLTSRVATCIDELATKGYTLRAHGSEWIIHDPYGGSTRVETIDNLEAYVATRPSK